MTEVWLGSTAVSITSIPRYAAAAIRAWDESEPVPGDPQIRLVAEPWNTGQVHKWSDGQQCRKAPRNPSERAETSGRVLTIGCNDMHLREKCSLFERHGRRRPVSSVSTILIMEPTEPVEAPKDPHRAAAERTHAVVQYDSFSFQRVGSRARVYFCHGLSSAEESYP
jgi:hypothetical protein